jgi:2-keto-4-pentenoate hydratase
MAVDIAALARRVLADHDARTPCQPLDLTSDQAYALQAEIARLRVLRGETVIGYKLGCTSKAIQQQLGIHEPIYGRLFATGCFASGARLSRAHYANLAIEGELALRLANDLSDSPLADDEWAGAIESIFPVIELHDYVFWSARPCAQDLIASNGMHAGFVVAEQPHGGPLIEVNGLSILINDCKVDGIGDPWTMDGPIAALRWLAARLGERGLRLTRGQVILTGSPMRLHPVAAGSRVVVEAPPLGKSTVEIDP